MADEIYTRLETEFKGIRDERGLHANTATRIGTAFLELLYLLRRFGIYEGKLASEDYVKDQQGFAIYKEGDKWKIEIDNAQIRNLLTAAEAEIGEATIDQAKIGTIKNRTEFLLGLKTFGSILLGNYASGVEGGIITATGDAELKELVTRGLARLAELLVDGDSAFGGKLSSLLFNSGFLTGQGWAILKEKVINAAGVEEDKYTLEIDNVTVRGLLRVYELVVSQLRGEYDNYRFAAMMSIHHYDPETGRIWLETEGGRIKGNPYNAGTYIECQQYQPGNDVVSGGDGYLTKHYEFIVKEAGTGGMTDVSGDRLDWITFKNFTTQIEGGTPESLIQKGDVIVRADHESDPERKGVVDIMTVGPKTPYMDVVYGRKTNPEDFLKSRIGNLEGVRTDLFGWLEGFGAYINNFYGVGKFFNRQTGEGLEARIEGTRQHLQSVYTETTFNISDDDNFITNGFFQRGLQSWVICETDGTPLSGEDDDEMIGSGDEPLLFNGNLLAYRNRLTAEPVVKDGIRMLHLLGMGVSQDFSLIKSNGYHDEMASAIDSSDTSFVTVADTLYMGIRILPVTSGTLSFKFRKNNGSVIGREFNLNAGHDWVLQQAMDSKSLPWDYTGSGKLVISYTGECYIRFVALQTDPIVNSKTQFTTLFEQTSRRITLEAKKASDDLTEAVASINIEYNRLTTTVTNNKTAADNALDSLRSRATSLEGRATSAEGRLDDLEDDSSSYATWIEQTDRTINLWAAQFDASGNIKKFSAIEQSISSIQTTVTNNKTAADNAFATLNDTTLPAIRNDITSAYNLANSGYNLADSAWDKADAAQDGVTALNATWVIQHSDRLELVSGQFDKNGKLTNTAGLVTGNGTFASLFASALKDDQTVAKVADITVFVDNYGKSNAAIKADRIKFETFDWTVKNPDTQNTIFHLDSDGNLSIAGSITAINSGNISMTNDVNFYVNGKKFARFGSSVSNFEAMLYVRNDGGQCISAQSFDGGVGLSVLGNAGSKAIQSVGPSEFSLREGETLSITSISSSSGFVNTYFAPYSCMRTSSFTLPSNPKLATLLICKGKSSDLIVTTNGHPILHGDSSDVLVAANSSYNFGRNAFLLFYMGSQWGLIYSA